MSAGNSAKCYCACRLYCASAHRGGSVDGSGGGGAAVDVQVYIPKRGGGGGGVLADRHLRGIQ